MAKEFDRLIKDPHEQPSRVRLLRMHERWVYENVRIARLLDQCNIDQQARTGATTFPSPPGRQPVEFNPRFNTEALFEAMQDPELAKLTGTGGEVRASANSGELKLFAHFNVLAIDVARWQRQTTSVEGWQIRPSSSWVNRWTEERRFHQFDAEEMDFDPQRLISMRKGTYFNPFGFTDKSMVGSPSNSNPRALTGRVISEFCSAYALCDARPELGAFTPSDSPQPPPKPDKVGRTSTKYEAADARIAGSARVFVLDPAKSQLMWITPSTNTRYSFVTRVDFDVCEGKKKSTRVVHFGNARKSLMLTSNATRVVEDDGTFIRIGYKDVFKPLVKACEATARALGNDAKLDVVPWSVSMPFWGRLDQELHSLGVEDRVEQTKFAPRGRSAEPAGGLEV